MGARHQRMCGAFCSASPHAIGEASPSLRVTLVLLPSFYSAIRAFLELNVKRLCETLGNQLGCKRMAKFHHACKKLCPLSRFSDNVDVSLLMRARKKRYACRQCGHTGCNELCAGTKWVSSQSGCCRAFILVSKSASVGTYVYVINHNCNLPYQ